MHYDTAALTSSIVYCLSQCGIQFSTSPCAASSVSQFQIDVDDLDIGQNVIRITFTSVSGAVRIVTLQVTRTQGKDCDDDMQ